ncbi:polysaccharide biosynthesis/export family protein [Mesorhizobium sp. PUT5]|uniref:polysaccharide biosynthesis/export family protein n=1 Tax=Mesorhizobium sp. PUT5 TaxID=3454629 RepID=UPI003FA42201
MSFRRIPFVRRAAGAALAVALLASPAHAGDAPLAPQTRIKLSVVQWMPTKGEYEDWQALGGEFVVSQAGTVQLPVLGAMTVGNLDPAGLAAAIASRLQAKLGLVEKPDTTVEIVEYPPVYVVGDVVKPGEYRFRSGITVLQALALSGGPLRTTAGSGDAVRLAGEFKQTANAILRSHVRIARLQAELADADEPDFKQVQAGDADAGAMADIVAQERVIFTARKNELARQSKALADLRDLLNAEINVLQEKIKAADMAIQNAQKELNSVTVLVDKGIAVASRKSDLERLLASLQVDKLDQVTAVMRARQGITQATRDLDGLQDKRRTDVASALQQEQAELEQAQLKQSTTQKLLVDAISSGPAAGDAGVRYSVIRAGREGANTFAATEATGLEPGDVVKVRLDRPVIAATGAAASAETAAAPAEASQ